MVGVYALNPDDYDGETVYVLLPGTCLTDEQLLSIIAAFDELGLTFDPDALNYRNCARGGGIETTRFPSSEERERYDTLAESIRRGLLSVPDDVEELARVSRLNEAYFSGMTWFSFRPYRSMTDEELIALLVAQDVRDMSGEIDYDEVESRSREALNAVFHCPLSMKLTGIYTNGSYILLLFTADGEWLPDYTAEGRACYGANFTYTDESGMEVDAITQFDKETGEWVSMSVMHDDGLDVNENPEDTSGATPEKIDAALAAAEELLNLTDPQWHVRTQDGVRPILMGDALTGLQWNVRPQDSVNTNWGTCLPARVQLADEWFFTLFIGRGDGEIHGMELSRGTLTDVVPQGEKND